MKQMTLKELLAEVAKLRLGNHRLRGECGSAAERYYEKDIVPQLADRLKKAMDALKYYENYLIFEAANVYDMNREKVLANLRLRMKRINSPNPAYPVVENATKECPKCSLLMQWWPKSNGWYCNTDFIFTPDRNVGPDPNTP